MLFNNAAPWRQQHGINAVQSGDITDWSTETVLPGARGDSQAIVTSNRVYLFGGLNQSFDYVASVITAPINTDGTLGTWASSGDLPNALGGSQAAVIGGYAYLFGGGYPRTSSVIRRPIDANGELSGSWSAAGNLPAAVSVAQIVITSNRIYLLGGETDTNVVATTYTAPINGSTGEIGTWTDGSALPAPRAQSQVVKSGSFVYLLGGVGLYSTPTAVIFKAAINSDGTLGTWATSGSIPLAIDFSQAVIVDGFVYLFGGHYSGSPTANVYRAPVATDGTIGSWTQITSLIQAKELTQAIITSSKIYLLGGFTGTACTDSVQAASFSGGHNDYTSFGFVEEIAEGVIGPPLESISSSGHSSIMGIGDVSSSKEVLSGQGTSAIAALGVVSPHKGQLSSSGSTSISGSGNIKPKREPITSYGFTGEYITQGAIVPRKDAAYGSGTTSVIGIGVVAGRVTVVAGDGATTNPISGAGRAVEPKGILSGSGATAITGEMKLSGRAAQTTGGGYSIVIGAVRIRPPVELVFGKKPLSLQPQILHFERPYPSVATSPSSPVIPMQFTRT